MMQFRSIIGAPYTNHVELHYRRPRKGACFIVPPIWEKILPYICKTCVDALFWVRTPTGPQILGGFRINSPHQGGFWYIGGAPKPFVESLRHAVVEHIRRDTGLTVSLDRIPDWVGKINDMCWEKSVSRRGGACDCSLTFFVELTPKEAAAAIEYAAQRKSPEFSSMALMTPKAILNSQDPRISDVFKQTIKVLDGHLHMIGAYPETTGWWDRVKMCLSVLMGAHDGTIRYEKWALASD